VKTVQSPSAPIAELAEGITNNSSSNDEKHVPGSEIHSSHGEKSDALTQNYLLDAEQVKTNNMFGHTAS
jgi:hypothetical protein